MDNEKTISKLKKIIGILSVVIFIMGIYIINLSSNNASNPNTMPDMMNGERPSMEGMMPPQ